jgi:hypothetical protein
MHPEGFIADVMTGLEFLDNVRLPCNSQEGRQPVVVLDDLVRHHACRDVAGPADHLRDPERALQLVFFSLRKGVMPPSGQVFMCGPLSVE